MLMQCINEVIIWKLRKVVEVGSVLVWFMMEPIKQIPWAWSWHGITEDLFPNQRPTSKPSSILPSSWVRSSRPEITDRFSSHWSSYKASSSHFLNYSEHVDHASTCSLSQTLFTWTKYSGLQLWLHFDFWNLIRGRECQADRKILITIYYNHDSNHSGERAIKLGVCKPI